MIRKNQTKIREFETKERDKNEQDIR